MKSALKAALFSKPVAQLLTKFFLRLHSWSYKMAGVFAEQAEPDRIHPKHRITNYHRWFLDNVKPEWTVADLGCGNGSLSGDLAKVARKVVGIDLSAKNIEKAKRVAPDVIFIQGDITQLEEKWNFDAVVLSNVLEHIEDRVAFLRKIGRMTDRLLIRVPLIEREWPAPYKRELGLDYRLDDTHFIEYTFEEYEREIVEAGFKIDSSKISYGELFTALSKNGVSK